jgi:hypothetical protein
MNTQEIGTNIARKVNEIVYGIIDDLRDEVEAGNIVDVEGMDSFAWTVVDNHEWVIYTHKAKLIATEADWEDCRAEHGAEAITPEMLAFFHLIEEIRGSVGYQELYEKLENGDD